MAKIIEVTNAGGAFLDKNDTKISINADLISRFEDLPEDNVGKTTIYLTNGISLNVVESQKQLRDIIINSLTLPSKAYCAGCNAGYRPLLPFDEEILTSSHIRIKINEKAYLAHRLAWYYKTEAWPIGEIDHKISLSNDWNNLRDVTHAQNQQNQRKPSSNNSTGFLGVTFNK